jgi:mannitol/fructose-specific phosphotransferase system IIA component
VAALPTEGDIPAPSAIRFGLSAVDSADAIDQCGRLLVEVGAVEEPYVAAMHEREASVPTYIGEEVAIPHGTNESRKYVREPAVVVLQFPGGVRWNDDLVRLCVAIAAGGDEQLAILSALARILLDADRAAALRAAGDEETVRSILLSGMEGEHA